MLEQFPETKITELVLVNLTSENSQWIKDLQGTSSIWSSRILNSLSDVQTVLETSEDAYLVVLHDSPEHMLTSAMTAGQTPSEALTRSQNFIESLAVLRRDHAERVMVLEVPGTPADPSPYMHHIAEHLTKITGHRLTVPETHPPAPQSTKDTSSPDPVLVLISRHLLGQKKAKRLHSDLQTSTLPAVEDLNENALNIMENAWRDSVSQRDGLSELDDESQVRAAEFKDLKHEKSLIAAQLQETQKELDTLKTRAARDQEEILAIRRSRDERSRTVAELRVGLKTLQSDLGYKADHIRLIEKRLHNAEMQIKRMKSSRSWKYTTLLRRINGTES